MGSLPGAGAWLRRSTRTEESLASRHARLAARGRGASWFLRLHVETSRITVVATSSSAIGAEGSVAPSYRGAFQAHAKWLVEKRAFGSGHYPWSAPEYKGDPERQFPCPNAVSVLDTDFNIFIHESCGEQEVADILTAIEKVEQAYCK